MIDRIRRHAVGLLALIVAMGGTAVAVNRLDPTGPSSPSAHAAKKKKKKTKAVVGAQGPQGAAGPQGPAGPPGQNGTGTPGPPGVPGASLFTASGQVSLDANGGSPTSYTYLPPSGHDASNGQSVGSPNSAQTGGDFVQAIPANLTLTAIVGSATASAAASVIPGSYTLNAQLYRAPAGSAVLTAVPGASCNATPPLVGVIPVGSQVQFNCTGLSIPLAAGDLALTVLSLNGSGTAGIFTQTYNLTVGLRTG